MLDPWLSLSLLQAVRRTAGAAFAVLLIATAASGLACSSSTKTPPPDNSDAAVSGAVPGAVDTHCSGMPPQPVSLADCHPDALPPTPDPDAAPEPEYGMTMFNAEGDDDDCKYHIKFDVMPDVSVGGKLTFKMTATKLTDGSPATGAIMDSQGDGVALEGFMDSDNNHVLPNTSPPTMASETPAGSGIYTITPVQFDKSGRWVARFHIFELCDDGFDDSPHGHAAFYLDIPPTN
jgi:hypothetical protein